MIITEVKFRKYLKSDEFESWRSKAEAEIPAQPIPDGPTTYELTDIDIIAPPIDGPPIDGPPIDCPPVDGPPVAERPVMDDMTDQPSSDPEMVDVTPRCPTPTP